tara:strand:- start:102534 stop:102896 length:363 start_codon:yes stop_codon:yes gene_type:complete
MGRAHIFLLLESGPEFVGACEVTVSRKHRGNKSMSTGIGVPLDMAKRLADLSLSRVYMLYTELVRFDDEDAFVRSVIESLSPKESDYWHPPAGFRLKDYQKPAAEFVERKLSENPTVSLL